MSRLLLPLALAALLLAGCNTATRRFQEFPTSAAALDEKTRAKIKRGVVEPGYTPEMVYLALGKPAEPAQALSDATRDGTWVYRNFHVNDRDVVRAGFRRRVVFDPVRKGDVVVTEPIDARLASTLEAHSLHVTFHDGHVVEVKRVAEL